MARFARIDSQIRTNCLICANRTAQFRVPKIANSRFEAIRANRSPVMKMFVFLGGGGGEI